MYSRSMKIAVLADIHANIRALEAVADALRVRSPDAVFVAGDFINRGPMPRACHDFIEGMRAVSGWRVIRGNHEDYVLSERSAANGRPEWVTQLCSHSVWTCRQMGDALDVVASLPHEIEIVTEDGQTVRCVHASMRGTRVGLYDDMDDEEMHELIAPPPDVLIVGHTHQPFIRRINRRVVLNAGSVGMPFDGDTRASFGWLEYAHGHWHAEIVRMPYDRAAADRDFSASGFLDGAGPLAAIIHREFLRARPFVSRWHRDYEAAVSSGRMTMAESMADLQSRI